MRGRTRVSSIDFSGARVLITGGAGFIGSHIADQLLLAGATRVVVLDDFARGRIANLTSAEATGRLQVERGDIRDGDLVDRLSAGMDYVFHQAAMRITQAAAEPRNAIEVMVNGTQNVLEAAVKNRVHRVVAASSASVYGEPTHLPMDELHPFNNRTLYGAAKILQEQMLRAYNEMFGLSYVGIRPFNVYGPRMDVHGAYTEVMIRWLECLRSGEPPAIFGDGTQTMDFIYVEDLAGAYLLAAQSNANDVFVNGGSGTETSLIDLCGQLCSAASRPEVKPVFRPARIVNSVSRRVADTRLAEELLGFRATTSLAAGLGRLIEWHSGLPEPQGPPK